MPQLDPEAIQAFVLVADLKSFTRAARSLNCTQAAVSLKISRLEKRLDKRLFERTPRLVRLSPAGETLLGPARTFAEAYQQVMGAFSDRPAHVVVGVSHHIVGNELAGLLRSIREVNRSQILDLRVGSTRGLLDEYDGGKMDAVLILRHDESRRGGEVVLTEFFAWMASPDFRWNRDEPLPLVLQPKPCHIRAMATAALRDAGQPWREAFLGAGVLSIAAAAQAGLGIAAMAQRISPPGLIEVGSLLGLPALPSRQVVLHSNLTAPEGVAILRMLTASLRRSSPTPVLVAAT